MCPVNGNCRNTPVEVFETKYPFLTLEYSMRGDSGGVGRHRGGLGSARRLRVMAPEITVSTLLDRTRTHAWGLFGGGGGASSALLVKKKSDKYFLTFSEAFGTVSASKFTRIVLKEGDEVIIEFPGRGRLWPSKGTSGRRNRRRHPSTLHLRGGSAEALSIQGLSLPSGCRDIGKRTRRGGTSRRWSTATRAAYSFQ